MTYEEGGPELQGPPEATCSFVLHTMTRPSLDQRCTFHPGHVGGHSFDIGETAEVAEIEDPDGRLPGPWYLWTGLGLVVLGLVVRWLWRQR